MTTETTDSVKLSELDRLEELASDFCEAYAAAIDEGGHYLWGKAEAAGLALKEALPSLIAKARATDDLLDALEAIMREFGHLMTPSFTDVHEYPEVAAARQAIARHRGTV